MKSRKKPSGRRRNKPEKPPTKPRRSPPKRLKPASRPVEDRLREMAKFPSENPFPVLRVAKDGTLLYANPAARSLVRGWGGALGRAVPKEWRGRVRRALVTGKRTEWEFEHRGRVFAVNITPIAGEGYVNLYGRDVTDHRRAGEAILRSKEEWERTFDAVPDLVAILDDEHRIVRINKAMADRLGVEAGACIGVKCHKGVHGTDHPPACCPHVLTCRDGKEHMAEVHEPRLGGDFLVSTTPLLDAQGRPAGAVHVARDITDRKRVEQALRESREDLNRAQSVAHTGSWRLDTRKNELAWSDENHRIFGVPEGTPMTYEFFLSTVHPEDRAYVDRMWSAGLKGEPYDIEHRILVNGNVKWVRERAELEFDKAGTLLGGFGTTQDITALKAAEQALREAKDGLEVKVRERTSELESVLRALRESETRYRSLVTATSQIVWTTDADGRVVGDIPSWRTCTGQSAAEVRGWGWSDALHPDDRERTKAVWAHSVESRGLYETEYRIRRADGVYRDFHVRGVPVKEDDGRIREWVGTCTDITDRKRAEEAVRLSEARYRALMEEAAEGILVADATGVILEANSSMCRMTGYEEPELLGRNVAELIPEEELVRKPLPMDEVRAGRTVTTERQVRRKDGAVIDVEGTAKLLQDGRMLLIARDISPRKRAAEMLRIYQARLKSMSTELSLVEERQRRQIARDLHDRIGQALAAAKMKIGALKTQVPSEPAHAALEDVFGLISRSIEDTRSLTFDLCPPVLYEMGLEPALDYLVETFQREHGVAASFETDGRAKPIAENLRTILYRSARELLINIAKHARATKVRVTSRDVGGRLQVVIEDDGTGFDASVLLAGVHPAGGFGLFSIREQMGYLGGFFEIESTPGRGTRAVLTAPLTAAKHQKETKP